MSKDNAFPLVVLISGSGSNLQALIDACRDGSVPARIAAVISNRADAYGLERAKAAGITTRILDHRNYPDRESYDLELAELVDSFQPAGVILAGFMRILTSGFVQRFTGRMLNIHPSLLPEFTGLNTHQRVLDAGEPLHGASVHFVTEELDGGPVILQSWIPVEAGDDAEQLAARVLDREHVIYPTVVRWLAEGRLTFSDGKIMNNGKVMSAPILLGPDQTPPY